MSTSMALLDLQDKITQSIDDHQFSIGIFLDLAKAFDTVNHSILIKKLELYGIRGLSLSWFISYLENRCQQVLCNGTLSKVKSLRCGVPQGSILGPLLFLLYINDLPNASKLLHFILFADDTNVFASHTSLNHLIDLINTELSLVADWFQSNRLSLNISKTNFILFCSHRKPIPNINIDIHINQQQITQVKSCKFLGVYIDSHLTWKDHIHYISCKISKSVGIMYRISYVLRSYVLLNLCCSLIYPYLSYCNLVWASNYHSRLKSLSVLQRRAVRIVAKKLYCIDTVLCELEYIEI